MIIIIFFAFIFNVFTIINFQAFADNTISQKYPDTMKLSIQSNPDQLNLIAPQDRQIHLKFFDANTNNLVKDVTFVMNISKENQTFLQNTFWTQSGSFTLNLKPGERYSWSANPDHDPIDLLYYSKGDQINIATPYLTDDAYRFSIQPVIVNQNNLSQQNVGGKFRADLNILSTYNETLESNANITNSSKSIEISTPLKQFTTGTSSIDITCRQDLLLIFKSSNEAPVCIKPDNAKKLESRGWAISQYHDPGAKPKIKLYDYSYDGMDKDNDIVSINNQTFYQTTLGYSVNDMPKKTSTSFHDVVFAFPQGTLITPGGSFVMLDMKFQDGFEEVYGGRALTRSGTATMIGGIPIPTQYGPHVAANSITILGNHTMPQAGITIYHDKIKLLVSVDKLLTENHNAVNSTAQVVPPCMTNILKQTTFAGNAGVALCPVMDYHVSSHITNYTGFYGKYDVLNSSSLVGPDTYVGTLQEEMDKSGNKLMDGNFVLEPGHNATITYQITLSTTRCIGGCPDHTNFPNVVNLTNNAEFIHREKNEMLYSHDGIDVKYDPQSVSLTDGQTTTLKATITASKDVPRGTYWVILAPGNCAGGLLILLTVSDCEK